MQQPENDLFNRPPEVMLALILNEFNSIASRMGTPLDLLRRFQDNPQAIQRYTEFMQRLMFRMSESEREQR